MSRLGSSWYIPLLLLIIAVFLLKPGRGSFMRVPITPRPVPEWEMQDLEGKTVTGDSFKGRVLVLNFWATWCPPCVKELPELQAFHEKYVDKDVVVIGASVDTLDAEAIQKFVQRRNLTFPVLQADESVQKQFGGISQIPTTFVVDQQGRFTARYVGSLTEAELSKAVLPLLRDKP